MFLVAPNNQEIITFAEDSSHSLAKEAVLKQQEDPERRIGGCFNLVSRFSSQPNRNAGMFAAQIHFRFLDGYPLPGMEPIGRQHGIVREPSLPLERSRSKILQ